MVFGLFKKRDPVCGMKEEDGKGQIYQGKWFCSDTCLNTYKDKEKKSEKHAGGSCCH
ncbi:YHS domain-containing protein [Candidatus Woesearchaeota archaeon CG10_big_fil_rev_8_21_14_0_10_33_12]|nr:MAG: YHS domain-containing protein [Candidatus Woesearchaeota archaeon CG10_big_fil_rev_8_21_14_0_10_33_12]